MILVNSCKCTVQLTEYTGREISSPLYKAQIQFVKIYLVVVGKKSDPNLLFYDLRRHLNSSLLRFRRTYTLGLPTNDETSETTVQNLYCLFSFIYDSLQL